MVFLIPGRFPHTVQRTRMSAHTSTRIAPVPTPSFKGVHGQTLTAEDLPPITTRWTVQRKRELMNALEAGVITEQEALTRYMLSDEELQSWKRLDAKYGPLGLRSSHLQDYRGKQMVG